MLFKFGKVTSPRCSFCKLHDETIIAPFYGCLIVKAIWNPLKSVLSNNRGGQISLWAPVFQTRNFTCAPDRAREKWVLKTKVYFRSRHN